MIRLTRALVTFALGVLLALPAVGAAAAEMAAPTPPADGELAPVVDVIDGDTIRIERDGVVERLRYVGIDTPESVAPGEPVEPWGPEAAAANAQLVADRIVLLERDVSERDRYERLLRYVWVETAEGWVMVNAELVAQGLAEVRAYEPDTKHHAWLRRLEDEARAAGRGSHGAPPDADDEPDLFERLLDILFGG